jgi:Spy/CpxP family protein refolding chaperone
MSCFVVLSIVLSGAMLIAQPVDATDTKEPQATTRPMRIPFPYQRMESITPEQKQQIVAVRNEIARQMEALRAKEREQILAILTPEQREEAAKMVEEARQREAAERERRSSSTRPAR